MFFEVAICMLINVGVYQSVSTSVMLGWLVSLVFIIATAWALIWVVFLLRKGRRDGGVE